MAKPNTTTVVDGLGADRARHDDDDDLLDIRAVCEFFGGTKPLHPSTIYRGIPDRYPAPKKLGLKLNRWRLGDCRVKKMEAFARSATAVSDTYASTETA